MTGRIGSPPRRLIVESVTYGNGTREQLAAAEWILDDFAELQEILKG